MYERARLILYNVRGRSLQDVCHANERHQLLLSLNLVIDTPQELGDSSVDNRGQPERRAV